MLILANITGWIVSHWRYVAAFLGLCLLALLLIYARGCYVDYKQGQVTDDLNNANRVIANGQDKTTILETERDTRRNEVINAETNVNQAINAVGDSRNTDSSKFNGNFSTVRQRFCLDYPNDSLCR